MPNLLPNQIVLVFTAVLSVVVLAVGWPRRRSAGGIFFIGFCVSLIIWLAGATFEAFAVTLETKVFWSQVLYIGFVQVVPYIVLFILSYTRQDNVAVKVLMPLMVIPLITLIMAWTNPLHGWLWSGFSSINPETNIAEFHHGFWFWVHTIYLYMLMVVGLASLIRGISGASPLFRIQLTPILIGVLFPVISGTIYAFDLVPLGGMDITPVGYAFTGVFLAWSLIRGRVLDILPVARNTVFEFLHEGVVVLDVNDHIIDINRAAGKMFNIQSRDVLGTAVQSALPVLNGIVSFAGDQSRAEIKLPETGGVVLEILITKLEDQEKRLLGKAMVVRDVTLQKRAEMGIKDANERLKDRLQEIKQLQGKLKQQALHDSLTGLYNRHIFEILEKEMSSAKRKKNPASLAIIDIDNFKLINDQYGHQHGDFLLKELSRSLTSSIRKGDYAARYGGDEIILFFPGMDIQDAMTKAEEIRAGFKGFRDPSGTKQMSTSLTIGVAAFPQDGENLEELFKAADRALYEGKQEGRNRVKRA